MQISFAVTAKLICAFVFATCLVQFLYFLNTKFQASSHLLWLHSPVCVRPGRKPEDRFSHHEAHFIQYMQVGSIGRNVANNPVQRQFGLFEIISNLCVHFPSMTYHSFLKKIYSKEHWKSCYCVFLCNVLVFPLNL